MKRWDWAGFWEGFSAGSLLTATAIVVTNCALPTGNARQGTFDHNAVNVPVQIDAEAELKAQLAETLLKVERIEAALIGPVTVGPIGGTHAGGDVNTTDSKTAQIMARTLQWSVLITVATVAAYVLAHRFRWSRCALDWAKGQGMRHEGTQPRAAVPHGESWNGKAQEGQPLGIRD